MDLTKLLRLLELVGPVIARAPQFVDVYQQLLGLLGPMDQATAEEALADIQAENDEGHDRLQQKLAEAARR